LLLDIGFNRSGYEERSTPALVKSCIEFAIESGWEYEAKISAPYELDCTGVVANFSETWSPGSRYS